MSDAVDGRSAARCRAGRLCGNTTLFYRSHPPRAAAAGTSHACGTRERQSEGGPTWSSPTRVSVNS
eukprot:7194480-Prymnesium_polylepis.1